MILHIPHASTAMINSYARLPRSYIDEYTDHDTDTLFCHPSADKLVFQVSRFFCDVERLVDDPLDAIGNGFYYTHTPDGVHCYRSKLDSDFTIAKELYDEWHDRLRVAVDKTLSVRDRAVIVDCHSFSDKQAVAIHGDDRSHFPDICIGYNGTMGPTARIATRIFKESGLIVTPNYPYVGSIAPMDDDRLHTIMIEVNKRLDYAKLKPVITEVLVALADFEINGA